MIIYPDIEIQGGKSVNLPRGLREDPVTYDVSPLEAAHWFQDSGAEWLHIVDLDGVFQGGRHNAELICKIIEETKIPVQIAGGIRTENDVDWWFDHGAKRIVLGTMSVKNQDLVQKVCFRYPGKIVISIDQKGGYALIDGWKTRTSFIPLDLARNFENIGAAAIIFTDIDRFENLPESSFSATTEIGTQLRIPVISSGMVHTLDDVSYLKYLPNISGAIIGQALFSGEVKLEDAIAIASGSGTDPALLEKGIQQLEKRSEINQTTTQNQTMGQELLDLDRAHKQGVISNTEYEQAKADILKTFSN